MRLVVTGGRHYPFYDEVDRVLSALSPTYVAAGCASGADAHALSWAAKRLPRDHWQMFEADWAKGKSAGPKRNREMLDTFKPDLVVAFPGHSGTEDCCRAADERMIPVLRYD